MGTATTPVFLPGELPFTEEPGRLCSSWHCKSRCPICHWRRTEAIINTSRKNEKAEPLWKGHTVMDVSGVESKVWCYKEQYCIGTWNVTSMNQGKPSVVKLEMIRVNIGIWRITELKWTGMGEFNSDDHYIYYCGQESLRRNVIALIVNKRIQNAVPGCILETTECSQFIYKGNHSTSQ